MNVGAVFFLAITTPSVVLYCIVLYCNGASLAQGLIALPIVGGCRLGGEILSAAHRLAPRLRSSEVDPCTLMEKPGTFPEVCALLSFDILVSALSSLV